MGLAGQIGAGAANALDDVIVQVLAKKKFDEQIRAQQAQEAAQQQQIGLGQQQVNLGQQRVDQDRLEFDTEQARIAEAQRAASDRAAYESTARSNMSELIDNPQQLAAFSLASGIDVPAGVRDLTKPKEKRYHKVTGIGPRGGPIARLVPEDSPEWSEGIQEYREPKTGPAPDYEWVTGPDGQPRQIRKGTAQPGDRPYDKAGAGAQSSQAEAVDTAREIQRISRKLTSHPGMSSAFGVVQSRLPTIRQSTADAETLRDAMMSLLTLENTGKLKGVLSNADMEILRRASTTLDPKMGDAAAAEELRRLDQVMSKITGEPAGGGPAPGATFGGPAPGTERVINGVPAVWDGRGWKPK